MRRVSYHAGLLFFSLIVGLAVWTPRALAAAPFSLTTSPVSIDTTVPSGTKGTQTLQVMNNSTAPVQVSVSVQTFKANGTNGEASIFPIPAGDPSAGYIHFSANTFVAQPGVWTPVQMTINLPQTAQLGYYYAVLFRPLLQTVQPQHGTTIKASNAILVLVDTHSANEQRHLEISSFATSKKLYEYLPVQFQITIHNAGNIFVPPTGDIFISKSSNLSNAIGHVRVNPGQGNVLPASIRIFKVSWTDGFPVFKAKTSAGQTITDKNGQPVMNLTWDFTQLNKFRFGKYYAHLVMVYNDGTHDIPVNSLLSFWVIPWKLILLAIVILLIIILGLVGVGRSIFRRMRSPKSDKPKPKKAKP